MPSSIILHYVIHHKSWHIITQLLNFHSTVDTYMALINVCNYYCELHVTCAVSSWRSVVPGVDRVSHCLHCSSASPSPGHKCFIKGPPAPLPMVIASPNAMNSNSNSISSSYRPCNNCFSPYSINICCSVMLR